MANHTQFRLSQEEVLYLLRSLGLPDLPGMGAQPWGHIPQDSALLVMETAGRGLVARGLVQVGEAQIFIDEALNQVLTASAYPLQMVVLTYSQDSAAVNRNYYRGKDYDIEHHLPYPWIHDFKTLSISDMGLGLVQKLVKEAKTGQASPVFLIHQAKLDEIRQAAASDVEFAAGHLTESGLPEALAGRFASALTAPQVKLLVQAVYQVREEVLQNVFTILSEASSSWLVSAGKAGDEQVQVMALDRPRLKKVIQTAFQPFQKV